MEEGKKLNFDLVTTFLKEDWVSTRKEIKNMVFVRCDSEIRNHCDLGFRFADSFVVRQQISWMSVVEAELGPSPKPTTDIRQGVRGLRPPWYGSDPLRKNPLSLIILFSFCLP